MLGEVNMQTGVAGEGPTVRIAVTQALMDLLAVSSLPPEVSWEGGGGGRGNSTARRRRVGASHWARRF